MQQALLKLLEGRQTMVPLSGPSGAHKSDTVQVDTTDILFIAAGTFSDLFDYRQTRAIGFGEGDGAAGNRPATTGRSASETLIAYGMLAEVLGR